MYGIILKIAGEVKGARGASQVPGVDGKGEDYALLRRKFERNPLRERVRGPGVAVAVADEALSRDAASLS